MKTREQRALKIAEYEGVEDRPFGYDLDDKTTGEVIFYEFTENQLIDYFSSFDGLMPIVERVNKERETYIEILYDEIIVRYSFNYENFTTKFCYGEYYPVIDRLQEAIIYYYEIKEGGE